MKPEYVELLTIEATKHLVVGTSYTPHGQTSVTYLGAHRWEGVLPNGKPHSCEDARITRSVLQALEVSPELFDAKWNGDSL